MAALHDRGTYVLLLDARRGADVRVGARGAVRFAPGHLLYVGSAFGAGGLAGRLRHHVRDVKRPRWHVDYVRVHAPLLGAWVANGPRALEHEWAHGLAASRECTIPARRLGASDCGCAAHLFHWRRRPTAARITDLLAESSEVGVAAEYLGLGALRRSLGREQA